MKRVNILLWWNKKKTIPISENLIKHKQAELRVILNHLNAYDSLLVAPIYHRIHTQDNTRELGTNCVFSWWPVRDTDEWKTPEKYGCYGKCINLPGYYECSCPPQTQGDPRKSCYPVKKSFDVVGMFQQTKWKYPVIIYLRFAINS